MKGVEVSSVSIATDSTSVESPENLLQIHQLSNIVNDTYNIEYRDFQPSSCT